MTAASKKRFLKIAFLLPNLKADGTQRAQFLIARGAAELGHRVELVPLRNSGPLASEVPPGVTLRLLEHRGAWSRFSTKALRRYIETDAPEIIISALNEANFAAWRATRSMSDRPRLVMTVHNHFEAKWRHEKTPTAPFRRRLFQFLYRRADHVVAVSEEIREMLITGLNVPAEKVVAITNSVDVEQLRALANAEPGDPWLNSRSNPPVIIAAGRLEAQKDFVTLIRAFSKVRESHAARLVIIGEGSQRKELERLVDDLALTKMVRLPGFQSNPYSWISRADVFALSSRWEGYPLVLLEALALGVPVVSTACPSGPSEILVDRPDALSPVGNIEAMAAALAKALENGPEDPVPVDIVDRWSPMETARKYIAAVTE